MQIWDEGDRVECLSCGKGMGMRWGRSAEVCYSMAAFKKRKQVILCTYVDPSSRLDMVFITHPLTRDHENS